MKRMNSITYLGCYTRLDALAAYKPQKFKDPYRKDVAAEYHMNCRMLRREIRFKKGALICIVKE